MKMTDTNTKLSIFDPSGCLNLDGLMGLHEKSLAKNDMTAAEGHIAECFLCGEALSGMHEFQSRSDILQGTAAVAAGIKSAASAALIGAGSKFYLWAAAAASVALLVVWASFYYFQNQSGELEKLYTQNFDVYPAPEEPKVNGQKNADEFDSTAIPDVSNFRSEMQNKDSGVEDLASNDLKNSETFSPGDSRKSVSTEDVEKFDANRNESSIGNKKSLPDGESDDESIKAGDDLGAFEIIAQTVAPHQTIQAAPPVAGVYMNAAPATEQISTREYNLQEVQVLESKSVKKASPDQKEKYRDDSPGKLAKTGDISPRSETSPGRVNSEEGGMDLPGGWTYDSDQSMYIDIQSGKQDAMTAYKTKNYPEAARLFETIIRQEPGLADARFYCGLSHLELKNPAAALPHFDFLIKNSNPEFGHRAKWYKSLALISLNRPAEAKELLDEISGEQGEFNGKAADLLEDLD